MANCPVCRGGVEPRFLCKVCLSSASEYDLVECETCAARYFRPMPTADELNGFYSNQYYGGDWYKQQGWGMAFAGSFLRGLPAGRFLDVGCGLGFFLDGIRKHSAWQVCGVEFSAAAVAYANRELELDVRQGELAEVGFPDAHFDYLHVCNVLEHVTDPVSLLRECRRIIKPGGTLHLRVPNGVVDSLDLINFYGSRRAPALSPSGHLFFFPRRTLLRMFDEAGFTVEKSLTYGVRRGLRSLGLYPRRGGWEDKHVAREHAEAAPAEADIVLPPRKERPDIYYKYRFLQLRLKMLPGMREFGLDYLLLLRPKV